MNKIIYKLAKVAGLMSMLLSLPAQAVIDGITGPVFNLKASAGYISTADGNNIYAWGYSETSGTQTMQFPGPTLIVNQGDTVTINLSNTLPVNVSMIFPGQNNVIASNAGPGTNLLSSNGLITREANALNGKVKYTFVATEPGTYMYQSGTQQELQVEMGLVGTLIVRPKVADPLHQAYSHVSTSFTHEYLFLLSEMDPVIHASVESQVLAGTVPVVDMSNWVATIWFINGRTAPDTLLDKNVPWLPNQPYNCVPRLHPGEKLLMRVVDAGRDLHPFHTHGNNTIMIARDGRMLESAPGMGADLATSNYTLQTVPGQTYDATFEWTGKGLGFDIYGHAPGDPLQPFESTADHGLPFPQVSPGVALTLPNVLDRTDGDFYGGSPFLGVDEAPRPGQVQQNLFGGYFHMWHSHAEREITNDNVYPGGMMTMVVIEPHGVPIP